jgi:uroporphyrin-III C-methyltransferase
VSSSASKGTVYLVGAGPGDPELLTLRAARLIATADVILHDDLVPPETLALAGRHTLVTSVGKRCGRPRITQAGIHALMIDSARAGQSVVRLKGGDPLIFGRAGEELAALTAAGIPFQIVPGVTAALAAGASLALPLTDRLHASKLILVTGHHADGTADRPLWEGALPGDATLVIYMPGRDMARIAHELLAAQLPPELPCCAVSRAGTPRQQHMACCLAQLGTLQPGPAPMLLLAGQALQSLVEQQPCNSVPAQTRAEPSAPPSHLET